RTLQRRQGWRRWLYPRIRAGSRAARGPRQLDRAGADRYTAQRHAERRMEGVEGRQPAAAAYRPAGRDRAIGSIAGIRRWRLLRRANAAPEWRRRHAVIFRWSYS